MASASTAVRRCPTSGSRRARKQRGASPARRVLKTAASARPTVVVPTPFGDAGVVLERPAHSRGLLVLGHGAGGGVAAPDLVAATHAAIDLQWSVARVLQPYRLAGRRAPAPAPQLDAAWLTVLGWVRKRRGLADVPLLVGGRSSGARVACRAAVTAEAGAVVALAFPLHPPGRPERSRAEELVHAGVPVYVVQGDRDPFGSAADIAAWHIKDVTVQSVAGADHALRTSKAAQVVVTVVGGLLEQLSR